MNNENSILLKLTDILEKEHLISVDEKLRAIDIIKRGGSIK